MKEAAVFHFLSQELSTRLTVVFASFVFWSLLFLAVYSRPTTSRLLAKTEEGKIGVRTHRAELATRTVAALHAALVGLGALNMVFFRPESSMYVPSDLYFEYISIYNATRC
jgi:hypothetical protein